MKKFRKIPVEVKAVQLLDNRESVNECLNFVLNSDHLSSDWLKDLNYNEVNRGEGLWIKGSVTAIYGDWIIKDTDGEFYTLKPDAFEKTYEAI